MKVTRRQFVKGGVAAFTVTFAAPEFLSTWRARRARASRNLVVLYLSGGNDSLSMLIPYNDPFYCSRRPTLGVPAGQVLQIGTDSSRVALGLHPRLTGLKQIFDQGRLALIQRTGYENQSRSHFLGTDIWSTADPEQPAGARLGRPLSRLAAVAGRSAGRLEYDRHAAARAPGGAHGGAGDCQSRPATRSRARTPARKRQPSAAPRCASASHVPVDRPELAFVYESSRPRWPRSIASRRSRATGRRSPIRTPVSGRRCRRLPARWRKVDWHPRLLRHDRRVRHALGPERQRGRRRVLQPDGDAERRRCSRSTTISENQGLLEDTLVLSFSEFGRRISENGSQGTDHGSASVMMAIGGRVNGGFYGTAPEPQPRSEEPDAREQRRRRPLRDRLPVGLRAGARQLAGRRLGAGCSAATSGKAGSRLSELAVIG